jgi:DNA polymerase
VSRARGEFVQSAYAPYVLATVHPSAVLRAEDADRARETARFVADLKVAAQALHGA